jgi:hypothetical protein
VSAAEVDSEAPRAPPEQLLRRVGAVAHRVEDMRQELATLHAAAVRAAAPDAITRAHLTTALLEALAQQSVLNTRIRGIARQAYFAGPVPRGRLERLAARLPRSVAKLGRPGQALVIAGSGLWRPTGRFLFDLRHIAAHQRQGADPAAPPPPSTFDRRNYLRRHPEGAARGPLLDFLLSGEAEGPRPHPLFEVEFYRQRNAEVVAASGLAPFAHFVRLGAQAGRDPHPFFDMLHYASQGPALLEGEDLPTHYLREGWRRGLSPHPLFDHQWYSSQMAQGEAETAPLLHFILHGAAQGLSPHPLFDPAWYLAQNPELERAAADPFRHFLLEGAARRLSPGPFFDARHYAARRGEGLAPEANPLVDYLQSGAWTVAEPAPGFATAAYLAAHPELVAEGLTPLEHRARKAVADRRAGD